jgi:hypothetical protein
LPRSALTDITAIKFQTNHKRRKKMSAIKNYYFNQINSELPSSEWEADKQRELREQVDYESWAAAHPCEAKMRQRPAILS